VAVVAKHGGINGHVLPSWNYLLDVVGGDYYELVWSATSTQVTMPFIPAGSPPPSTASAIFTVTQQAGILAGTGITAINSLTGAVQTLANSISGTTPAFNSTGTTHTLNIPLASTASVTAGLLSNTDYTTFNGKADLASPAFTGTPTAPTAAGGTNTTQIATTAFVQSTISGGASVPSYTMKANNTGASAVPTDQVFRFPGWQSYNTTTYPILYGTPTPATPFGAGTYLYNWTRIGNVVHFTFYFALTTGITLAANTNVTWSPPADMPAVFVPSGITGTSYINRIFLTAANGTASTSTQTTMGGGITAAGNFNFVATGAGTAMRLFSITSTYFTS